MAKKKRAKTTTSTRPAASKQVWAGQDPTDAATTLPEIPAAMVDALQAGPSAAERRARLMAAEPIEAEDETAPEPEAEPAVPAYSSSRFGGVKVAFDSLTHTCEVEIRD